MLLLPSSKRLALAGNGFDTYRLGPTTEAILRRAATIDMYRFQYRSILAVGSAVLLEEYSEILKPSNDVLVKEKQSNFANGLATLVNIKLVEQQNKPQRRFRRGML
ncbi:hypothetical protein Y032_0097g3024 [Ancylostoma ceylanicum]|uniref:Uncharacterized protein n=1 Tax=Ancylostoma ceylanicum TaxID=53326 RepID=A0A016TJR2_9BILA|nr:hypothetical protein Y032_0097g3024 [Ancylostoma ceylanicum]